MNKNLVLAAAGVATMAASAVLSRRAAARDARTGEIEVVAKLRGPMPTGVTVSATGRIFVNFPRWGDDVEFTVAELVGGEAVPFPDAALNRYVPGKPAESLVSVQSVVVDPADRLWMLDTGTVLMGPVHPGGAKLIAVDLATNEVVKRIDFPSDVALNLTYLNDVRFDLRRGTAGMAFITDSSSKGENAIIAVDLDTGRSWRRLRDHPSTKPDPDFHPIVEGERMSRQPKPDAPEEPVAMGADGIAISADGSRLFYCPLGSRRLYSVSVDALADPTLDDAAVAATVEDLGVRDFASDGLETDAEGRLYLTDFEHDAIRRRTADGAYEIVAQDPSMLWPDTLSLGDDGWLYFTANQLHRQPDYQAGKDRRKKPYLVLRTRVDARPVRLE